MGYYSQILHKEGVSAVTTTGSVDIGTRIFADGREYVYMYNGGAIADINRVVCVTGTSGYTFVVTYATSVTTSPTPFGVIRNQTIAAGSFGWVMTRGFTNLVNEGLASIAAGQPLILGLNGAVRSITATSVVTQMVWNGILARSMEATDASIGTFGAYVRLG
jgi:hypothetical protein